VISGYQVVRPRWIERFTNYWLYIPVVWPMQARMLAVLKRNIEQPARAPQLTASAETTAGSALPS
jgi:proline iminopeptidase